MLKIAIDLDGTALQYPDFYNNLANGWNGEIFFLTARPTTEVLITLNELEKSGLHASYNELIMYPVPHIFDIETKTFWYDTGEVVFTDMEHREKHLAWLRSKSLTRQYDTPVFAKNIAEWKAKECLKRGITSVFEDNEKNVKTLQEYGIYTFLVNRDYGSNGK